MRRIILHYVTRHSQAAMSSLGQLSRVPFASFITCLIIGIALAFPTALFVTLKNFSSISGNLQQTTQITLYLKLGNKEKDVSQFVQNLRKNPLVDSIKIISPEQGLKELQQQAGFEGALVELTDNPLPWTLIVAAKTADELEPLAQSLQSLPQVDSLQLNKLWVKRLAGLISLAQRTTYALAIFLSISVFLLISNAIGAATRKNEKEIEIIKLIGGTHAFIRRPFLYAGIIYGLLGGIIAWQLVDILMLLLKSPIRELTGLYNSQYQIIGIGLSKTLILLGVSMLLGLLGSWLAVSRHLKTC